MKETTAMFTGTTIVIMLLVGIVSLGMWGCPKYNVYSKTMNGKAQLEEARQNRQIAIEEAQARLESSKLDAQAEIERARGMAKAMEIENGQLSETYNQYLFIRSLEKVAQHGDLPQIIYVPSKGMLPVMDVNKHTKQ